MRSYIALVWNPHDPDANRAAEALDRCILDAVGPEAEKVAQSGFALHDLSCPSGKDAIVSLGTDDENQAGAMPKPQH